jgi:hypothetical protein
MDFRHGRKGKEREGKGRKGSEQKTRMNGFEESMAASSEKIDRRKQRNGTERKRAENAEDAAKNPWQQAARRSIEGRSVSYTNLSLVVHGDLDEDLGIRGLVAHLCIAIAIAIAIVVVLDRVESVALLGLDPQELDEDDDDAHVDALREHHEHHDEAEIDGELHDGGDDGSSDPEPELHKLPECPALCI